MLGLVLAWLLLKHLPDKDRLSREKDELIRQIVDEKDKRVRELLEMHLKERETDRQDRHTVTAAFQVVLAETVRVLTEDFNTTMKQTRDDYKENMKFIVAQHDRQVSDLASAIRREFQKIHDSPAPGGGRDA